MAPGLLATDSGVVNSRSQIRIIPLHAWAKLLAYLIPDPRSGRDLGLGHVILEPLPEDRVGESYGRIRRRKRLGGLLRAMHRAAPAISWNVCPKDY
jgi:hypothetical protein